MLSVRARKYCAQIKLAHILQHFVYLTKRFQNDTVEKQTY